MSNGINLAERSLVDGSQTVIALDLLDGVLTVSARNCNGVSMATAENGVVALEMFNHPFSKVEWLDYPTAKDARRSAGVVAYAECITAERSA